MSDVVGSPAEGMASLVFTDQVAAELRQQVFSRYHPAMYLNNNGVICRQLGAAEAAFARAQEYGGRDQAGVQAFYGGEILALCCYGLALGQQAGASRVKELFLPTTPTTNMFTEIDLSTDAKTFWEDEGSVRISRIVEFIGMGAVKQYHKPFLGLLTELHPLLMGDQTEPYKFQNGFIYMATLSQYLDCSALEASLYDDAIDWSDVPGLKVAPQVAD